MFYEKPNSDKPRNVDNSSTNRVGGNAIDFKLSNPDAHNTRGNGKSESRTVVVDDASLDSDNVNCLDGDESKLNGKSTHSSDGFDSNTGDDSSCTTDDNKIDSVSSIEDTQQTGLMVTEDNNAFINYLMQGDTQRLAYQKAFCKFSTSSHAAICARQLLTQHKLWDEYKRRKEEVTKQSDVKRLEIITELRALGISKITDVMNWDREGSVKIIPSHLLPKSVASAIKKIKSKSKHYHIRGGEDYTVHEIEVEMHSKTVPLTKLGEHLGLWEGKGPGGPANNQPHFNLIELLDFAANLRKKLQEIDKK